jgi:hypothetical protein
MTRRDYRSTLKHLLGLLYALAIASVGLAAAAVTGGCSTVSLSRTDDGVTLEYKTFLTKIEAPQVQVEKDGDYAASFNAESKSSDLEIMRDMMSLVAGRTAQGDPQ